MKNSMYKLLYGLYHTKIPTMLWGNPGIGKTQTIMMLARELGKPCLAKSANKSDPSDFEGLPIVDENSIKQKIVTYVPPAYVKVCTEVEGSILFFDEITTCSRIIQNALLSIIQDCNFGEFSIPVNTFRVAAGNYDNVAGCHGMGLATQNRFCHLFCELGLEEFINGIKSEWKSISFDIPTINSQEDQMKKEIHYRILIGDFLKENPVQFYNCPEEVVEKEDVAYPTPRSWENVVEIMSVLDGNDIDYVEELVQGTVGKVAGSMFCNYVRSHKDIGVDLTTWLGKEDKFVLPHPDRHDEVANIMASIVFFLKREPKKYLDLWIRIMNVMANLDKKYGTYTGYNNFVMQYMKDCVKMLLNSGVVKAQELKALKDRVEPYSLMSVF